MRTRPFSWDDPIGDDDLERALVALRRALGIPAAAPRNGDGDWLTLTQPTDPRYDHTGLVVLDAEACYRLIGAGGIGRVAFVVGPQPIILTINYTVDETDIVLRTASGIKLEAMPGARVAFQIDGFDAESSSWWSVLVQGAAELVDDPLAVATYEGLPLEMLAPGRKSHWIRIRPIHVSGRTFPIED